MGNALFHPYKDNSPPKFDAQPFKDDPYKNRGIAWVKLKLFVFLKGALNGAPFFNKKSRESKAELWRIWECALIVLWINRLRRS